MSAQTKILIIEDNDDIRESTAEILELADFEVFHATDGKQGVEQAIKIKPDLILCDIMMPELDGYEVLYMLEKNLHTSTIPFIFLTAKNDRVDMRRGMEMGADDYLTKPFGELELLNAISSRLKKFDHHKKVFGNSLDSINELFNNAHGLDELKRLFSERKIRHIKKKQIIYYEGDSVNGIYLIASGRVKTMKIAEDGRELLISIFGPEEYFGVAALLANEDYKETAEAMEDTSLCLLPRELVQELIGKYPDVASKFINILANSVLESEQQLLQLAYYSVRKRMAELLLRLRHRSGEDDLTKLNISRDNLASMAGIATETVSRILSDFKEEGIIAKDLGQLIILDQQKLEKMKN
ncbi:response regulator [Pedobacter sp. ASV28]|uniref:response regulator n=1 Tax=Pedobacter sp. ASV28 TaxID=2795123 RepID=UPI0018ED5E81|nr:response regulator [Pedobacter sp. ASV28]